MESPEAAPGAAADGSKAAAELAAAVDANRKDVGRLLRAAKALSAPWSDPKAIEKALAEVAKRSAALPPTLAEKASDLAEAGKRWLAEEKEGRRQKLGRDLKEACTGRGLRLLLVTKDPLEIRLPPLGVRIDLEKASASIVFGQIEIAKAQTGANEILDAREKALKTLEGRKWSAREFHGQLREAWSAVSKKLGRADGWVELGDVIPEIAIAIQGQRWRLDPTSRNFTSYGKAQFLYDLHRLREAGGLSQGGWRLSLGPATGASTRDKRRVFWVEDGEGRGAYHLTLRFVREEAIHGEEK